MEDKQGEQQLCVCVSLCVCVCVRERERDGERSGDGWTISMMEQFDRKFFFLKWADSYNVLLKESEMSDS